MIACLRTYVVYRRALHHELFSLPLKDKTLLHASESSFNRISYRFPLSATSDLLISLRILKLLFSNVFKFISYKKYSENSGIAVFDVSSNSDKLRNEYIERLTGRKINLFIGRDELIRSPGFSLAVAKFIYLLFASPFTVLFSLVSKNKLKIPLHLLNTIEAQNITRILIENNIKELHYFCIYETDSNLMAYTLMKNGIHVNKIPSEVPLHFLNRTIVADTLSFCFRYQEEEYYSFMNTMHVNKLQHWIPENSFNLESIYLKNQTTPKNTIGFYSSAMWYRKENDSMDLLKADEHEKELLENLIDFVKKNPENKLVIFLHPIEKRNLEKAMRYYNSFGLTLSYADTSVSNAKLFNQADVVLSLYSTLSFERIFWGFKTIIFPLGQIDFPLSGSVFNSICAITKEDLFLKLKYALSTDSKTYYQSKGMENYSYTYYQVFNK